MFCSASSIADSKDFFCLSATQIDPAQIRLFCWAVKSQHPPLAIALTKIKLFCREAGCEPTLFMVRGKNYDTVSIEG